MGSFGLTASRYFKPDVWSPCRCEMTAKSRRERSTPSCFTFLSKLAESLPVSKRMRLPSNSTSAEKPQSRSTPGVCENASYRIEIRADGACGGEVGFVLGGTAAAPPCGPGRGPTHAINKQS